MLAVTDYIPAPIQGMHKKPTDPPTEYRTALLLGKDGPESNAANAAYVDGNVENGIVTGGIIRSKGECFNNLIITDGRYKVRNLTIENTGHSVDDGKGLGCGILAGGDSRTEFYPFDNPKSGHPQRRNCHRRYCDDDDKRIQRFLALEGRRNRFRQYTKSVPERPA